MDEKYFFFGKFFNFFKFYKKAVHSLVSNGDREHGPSIAWDRRPLKTGVPRRQRTWLVSETKTGVTQPTASGETRVRLRAWAIDGDSVNPLGDPGAGSDRAQPRFRRSPASGTCQSGHALLPIESHSELDDGGGYCGPTWQKGTPFGRCSDVHAQQSRRWMGWWRRRR